MLELQGMQSASSLPSLLGPLWPGVVVPDTVLSMGQIELNCKTEFFEIELFLTLKLKVKLATVVKGDPKALFSVATTPRCKARHYSIPWITSLYH